MLVSGATSGLGFAAAEGFARLGASVRLLARSEERGERARAEIVARSGNGDVHVDVCDLSDLAAVRRFASSLSAATPRLDVLVNNAGVLLSDRAGLARRCRADVRDQRSGPSAHEPVDRSARTECCWLSIINVSSGGMYMQRIHLEDLQSDHGEYDGATPTRARSAPR